MASALLKRVETLEVKAKSLTGNLDKTVYGIIDRVDKIDGVLVPNVIRCWEGEIGSTEPIVTGKQKEI